MLSDSISDYPASLSLAVLRLHSGREVVASLQSDRLAVLETHWLGRQLACAGEGCPACVSSRARAKGYAVVQVDVGGRWAPVLVEASVASWSRVDFLNSSEGLSFAPGLELSLTKRKRNSPVRIEPIGMGGPVREDLVPRYRLLSAIAVLFGLPSPRGDEPDQEWVQRCRPAVLRSLEAAMRRA